MEAIIGLVISILGYVCYGIDFCTLFTFVSVAIDIYKILADYTNDKATRR